MRRVLHLGIWLGLMVLGAWALDALFQGVAQAQQPSPRGRIPWACEIIVGSLASGAPTLTADEDTSAACPNDRGVDITITGVACLVDSTTGTPTVNVKVSSAGASILTGAISCGTSWTAGTLSGTPILRSFTTLATCSTPPCDYYIDYGQTGAGAHYVAVKLVGSHP